MFLLRRTAGMVPSIRWYQVVSRCGDVNGGNGKRIHAGIRRGELSLPLLEPESVAVIVQGILIAPWLLNAKLEFYAPPHAGLSGPFRVKLQFYAASARAGANQANQT